MSQSRFSGHDPGSLAIAIPFRISRGPYPVRKTEFGQDLDRWVFTWYRDPRYGQSVRRRPRKWCEDGGGRWGTTAVRAGLIRREILAGVRSWRESRVSPSDPDERGIWLADARGERLSSTAMTNAAVKAIIGGLRPGVASAA